MDQSMSLNEAFRAIVKEENEKLLESIKELLAGIERNTDDSKPLNLEEACEYLACSASTLYKLTSTKEIPHFKRRKKLLFKKNELDDWMLAKKVRTIDEIKSDALSKITKERRS